MPFLRKYHLVPFVFFFVLSNIFLASLVFATNVGVSLLETPASIIISPTQANLHLGEKQNFSATATFSSSSPSLDVTTNSLTTWTSDNEQVAIVNNAGLVTAVSKGSAHIVVTYGGKSDRASITISSINSTPPQPRDSSRSITISTNDHPQTPPPTTAPPPQTSPPPVIQPPPAEKPLSPPSPAPQPVTSPQPMGPPPSAIPPTSLTSTEPGTPEPPLPTPPASSDQPPVLIEPGQNQTPSPVSQNQNTNVFSDENLIGFFPSHLDFDTSPDTAIIQTDFGPVILPSDLSVTRGEILHKFLQEFEIEKTYKDLLDSCSQDLESCLSIFLNTTNFDGVNITGNTSSEGKALSWWQSFVNTAIAATAPDLSNIQLYPDVSPHWPYARDVNIATVLGIVQGYYTEPNSPFKPQQALTRMEAVKMLLGAVRMVKWMYYDELEALLGGPIGIKSQKTPFADVTQDKTYMWWYPRYLNKACEIKMIDCTLGHNFRPQDYVTDAELKTMMDSLKKYTDQTGYLSHQDGDDDGDGIKNYMEESVYLTNPENSDTDGDKISDYDEIFVFKTNPFLKDTDGDGLSDYDEIYRYKTNPLQADTDGDGFSDALEIRNKTNPLDPASHPQDKNNNFIDDKWEKQYHLDPNVTDTDNDGFSDALEYQFGTNPLQADTDGDGFSDAEEILQLKTDPLNAEDPGSIEKLGVRITNIDENQTIADPMPFIQGVAPANTQVRLILRNDFGAEKVLGDTLSADNNVFTFRVQKALRAGKYQIMARALQPSHKAILDSAPIHIIINPDALVNTPKPNKLANESVTDDNLLKQVRIEIQDRKPILVGKTEFGSKVSATWKSLVTTSALIADNVSGEFRITPPRQLELGNHEIYLTATRRKDGIQSKTIKIPFAIGASLGQPVLKGAANETVSQEVTFSEWLPASLIGVAVLAFVFVCLQRLRKKK